jgi:DNA-binding response OmpR family regulator
VLLVDDDPLVRKVYEEGLTRHGFEVQTAEDGLNAILLLRSDPPDVLVLDLMMPKLSGSDVLKFIQSQPGLKQLLIIVLSNSFLHEGEKPILEAGAQRVLIKLRSTPAVLAAEIEACLQGDPPATPPPV